MHKQQKTRKEKIRFIKDLMSGKASVSDASKGVTGGLFIHGGKVFAYQSQDLSISFEEGKEVEEEVFKQLHPYEFKNTTQRNLIL